MRGCCCIGVVGSGEKTHKCTCSLTLGRNKMSKCSKGCLVALFLCLLVCGCTSQTGGCTDPAGITVTPSTNQTVPSNTDFTITYRCQVDNNRRADWSINGNQITIGSNDHTFLLNNGVNISVGVSQSEVYMTVNQNGTLLFRNQVIKVACTALMTSPVFTRTTGCNYFIRTFDIPDPPPNLDFNPTPENLEQLVISWDQPPNTIIDTGDPVLTTYTVTVTGPTFNFTNTTTDTEFAFRDDINQSCAMHNFQVFASNEAGSGPPDVINETIPISPDIAALSADLRVSNVFILPNNSVIVEATFPQAIACSSNFPLTNYLINVVGLVSHSYSVTDPRIAGRELITLNLTSSQVLPDMISSLTVSACISVTCRDSPPVELRTTDVQSASLTFHEFNIFLTCSFARTTQARGCVFIFTVAPNITEEFMIPVTERTLCAQTLNMENVYSSIQVFDWEGDGSVGGVALSPFRRAVSEPGQYQQDTGCELPTPEVVVEQLPLDAGGIAGIVIAVLFVLALVIAVIIAVVVVRKRARNSKVDYKYSKPVSSSNGSPSNAQAGPSSPNWDIQFNLKNGRKKGEIKISKQLLDKLNEDIGSQSEVTYLLDP